MKEKRTFAVLIGLQDPNPRNKVDFTEKELTKDIMTTCEEFNVYHKGMQKLKITEITSQMINVELMIMAEPQEDIEAYRKIGLFSRRLYNDHGWAKYSNTTGRLFTVVAEREITDEIKELIPEKGGLEKADNEIVKPEKINLKKEHLIYLYAQKRYIDAQIAELEEQGISVL